MPEVAVIIGGAECWEHDLEKARKLIGNHAIRFYFVNDQIATFPEAGVAVSLHPNKLDAWLALRRKAGLPQPEQIWGRYKHAYPEVTHDTENIYQGGSSGLLAVQVARREGHERIVAVGIPMTIEGGHYVRHEKWDAAIRARPAWEKCKNDLAPYFRSMSGWTAEIFGEPDEEWLR